LGVFDALAKLVGGDGANAAAKRLEGGERGRQGSVLCGVGSDLFRSQDYA
jgi:hypothetical protein